MCHSAFLRKDLQVLVVDATADCRELLTVLFDQYDVKTTTAACVSEAIESMEQTCPDLVISEIALPREDGYSLIRKVKDFETIYGVQIPAIALTVYAKESDRIHALTAGFCSHLTKPLNIDQLIATVACITSQEMPAAC